MYIRDRLYIVTFKGEAEFKFSFFSRHYPRNEYWYIDLENEFNKRLKGFTYKKENIIKVESV